jgi:hypothetical protein
MKIESIDLAPILSTLARIPNPIQVPAEVIRDVVKISDEARALYNKYYGDK